MTSYDIELHNGQVVEFDTPEDLIRWLLDSAEGELPDALYREAVELGAAQIREQVGEAGGLWLLDDILASMPTTH